MAPDPRTFAKLDPPARLLMGPGPSNVHPRVLQALAAPTIGHLDPALFQIMDEIQSLLRMAFGTQNRLTFPVSGTGSAGMEAAMCNVLERGDRVVIAQNGIFGGRMADIAGRLGCEVTLVEAPFGEAIDPGRVADALRGRTVKLVGIVHAETSTGVQQSIPEVADLARRAGALCLVDCVTSLGGIPVDLDAWGVDIAYAGTQKCLSCPPGLAPITFSDRAVEVLKERSTKVASWYLDATMLLSYWGGERLYHHTAPVNMLYGLRESLLMLHEEGLSNSHARHALHHRALVAGLEAMGLALLVPPQHRLPQLNAVVIPTGVDDAAVRKALLSEHGIEIGGGLGSLKGKVWRIGLMGHTARRANVERFLAALEAVLASRGAPIRTQRALAAAERIWSAPPEPVSA